MKLVAAVPHPAGPSGEHVISQQPPDPDQKGLLGSDWHRDGRVGSDFPPEIFQKCTFTDLFVRLYFSSTAECWD